MMEKELKEKQKKRTSRKASGLTVIQLQLLLCILCAAAVLGCRSFMPEVFEMIRQEYRLLFEAQETEEEPIRFAQALLNELFLPAEAASKAPEGCSNETYLPRQSSSLPVQAFTVTSDYGWRTHPITGASSFHNGIDLACAEGSAVYAAMSGMVQHSGCDAESGNYIILMHENGVVTSYCHLQFIFVRAGEFLEQGQTIGTVGQTGMATGPHLHFGLKYNDIRYDPSALLGL